MTITISDLEAAIRRSLPGYKLAAKQSATVLAEVVKPSADAAKPSAPNVRPTIEELRERFLKRAPTGAAVARELDAASAASKKPVVPTEPRTVVLTVEPEHQEDGANPAFQKKVAVSVNPDGTATLEAVQG
ncbi:MAG: hypothetical protein JNK05_39510 [Myxococcales bacterium]|nr:hypothetical protein [Myxococcales bacterium]